MMKAYAVLALGFALGCVADVFLCRWGKSVGNHLDLVYGIVLYTADTMLWAYSVKLGLKFWRAGLLWTLGSLVLCVLVGMWFKERPSLVNWFGIALAFVAAALVEA
jgi:multidrug transporter EmrE-like cation transporter